MSSKDDGHFVKAETISSSLAATVVPSAGEMALGLGLFCLSIGLYSVYCLLIKIMLAEFSLSVPEINYYISLCMIVLFYLLARSNRVNIFNVPKGAQRDLILRCVFGVLSDVLLFTAYEFTSFSKAFCIFFTNTLMAPFLSRAILGEPIKKWDIIGILCGFGGMLMLIQPFKGMRTPTEETTAVIETEGGYSSDTRDMIGVIIALVAALNAALAIIHIRKLANNVHYAI